MQPHEWSQVWHNPRLDVEFLQASYVRHAYPRHSHDYYVICVIEQGLQSFTHKGARYFTPAGGVILINPGAAHTGEAVNAHGFQMRCVYPTTAHMDAAVYELTGRHQASPYFRDVRVDHPWARDSILTLHLALSRGTSALECDSLFTWTLARLVERYAEQRFSERRLGNERNAVDRARHYIDERFSESINLAELAAHVSLSPYYLLRAFHRDVGMPPHAYQESLRIREAERLIKAGLPLAQIAAEVGFSSQSHLTNSFKRILGVTPGQIRESRVENREP